MRSGGPVLLMGLVALCASPRVASAQSAPGGRVLVMPFAAAVEAGAPGGEGTAHWIGEGAAVLLGEGLTARGLTPIPRDERLAAFDRLQLPSTPVLTRATLIRVAELVGASDVVFGDVRLGERLVVHARVLRVGAAQEMPATDADAPLADIFTLFERVSTTVASSTGRVGTSVRAAPANAPLSLAVFENYVKGLVAEAPSAQQRFLEAALVQAPKDARILTALWGVYSVQGLHDKALAAANAVPADSTMYRKARFAVALSLVDLKRFDGALRELTTLEAAGRSPAIANAMGVVQLRRGGATEAVAAAAAFGRAVAAAPADTDYLFNLGYAHALAQNAASALSSLREAVRYDAANGDAHLVMSAVLVSTGRTAEAQRELDLARLLGTRLETAIPALGPKVPAGLERLDLDLDLAAAPRPGAAMAVVGQADQRETAAFHLARGRLLFDDRKDREATPELRRAIYLAPYEDEPHILLGRVYQRAGQISDAIDEFKVAIWCRETVEARLALAAAYLDSSDREAARREADRALVLAPDSAEARALIRRIGG